MINYMDSVSYEDKRDKPWWTLNSNGRFSTKSSWKVIRTKEVEDKDLNSLWSRGIPFKFSFLAWRIWKGLIPAALLYTWNT